MRASSPAVLVVFRLQLFPVELKGKCCGPSFGSPHAVKYQSEPQHANKTVWEDDALVVGGSAAGGAVIGASIGGKEGAVAGGVGGLIYDLLAQKKGH
jgi:hypothetical protein